MGGGGVPVPAPAKISVALQLYLGAYLCLDSHCFDTNDRIQAFKSIYQSMGQSMKTLIAIPLLGITKDKI